jgi:amidophosphoribosyltransferase
MCGIVGITGHPQASQEAFQSLLMLQHRGQDSAGILSADVESGKLHLHREMGQVSEVFGPEALSRLQGRTALGHTRYSTIGSVKEEDLQPMVAAMPVGLGLVHNGNVSNFEAVREKMLSEGRFFLSDNDLEFFLHFIADEFQNPASQESSHSVFAALTRAVARIHREIEGGYSVIGTISGRGLFGFRDPHAIRPLILGRKKNPESEIAQFGEYRHILTSETGPMKFLGYEIVRDLEPGELIWIPSLAKDGAPLQTTRLDSREAKPCMFEWVYFSGADSTLEGRNVYQTRLRLGEALARVIPEDLEIDFVCPVPDTSRPAAIALAEKLAKPFREVLIKNRYVQRSFILPRQDKRELVVSRKFSVVEELVRGKSILLVDDSIVRGTTSRKIVDLLREHGARRVYMASTCPPIEEPCFYGIDFPDHRELIAFQRNASQIADEIHADRVFYTSVADLKDALSLPGFCGACITGEYPYGRPRAAREGVAP